MDQLETWRLNIMLGIGCFVLVVVGGVLLLVFWTGIRAWLFTRRMKLGEEEARRDHTLADGTTAPPSGRGVCQQCGRVLAKVYFLPDGRKLCPTCFAPEPASDQTPTPMA